RAVHLVALRIANPHFAQHLQRGRIFHEFGNGGDSHHLTHLMDSLHHGIVDGVLAHVLYEQAVDLEEIHRQAAQITERGKPGTEIVQGELAPALAQALDKMFGALQVGDHGGFGDLETNPLGLHAAGPQLLDYVFQEGLVAERLPGDVERETAYAGELRIAGARAHPLEHHADYATVYPGHHMKALGCGQESAWRNQAAIAVQHVHKKLAQHRPLGIQRLDPLNTQAEEPVVQRALDAGGPLHLAVPMRQLPVVRINAVHTIAALILGYVTSRVGRREQIGGGGGPVHRHQSYAYPNIENLIVPDEAE